MNVNSTTAPIMQPFNGNIATTCHIDETRSQFDPACSLEPIQEWEGYVTSVSSEIFTANLVDITRRGTVPEEVAEFPIAILCDDNRALLREGAVFRWVIGHQHCNDSSRQRVHRLVLRRLPAWTGNDIKEAGKRASWLAAMLGWD